MQIFLDKDITTTKELDIFLSDIGNILGNFMFRILRTIHKTKNGTTIKVSKTLGLADWIGMFL